MTDDKRVDLYSFNRSVTALLTDLDLQLAKGNYGPFDLVRLRELTKRASFELEIQEARESARHEARKVLLLGETAKNTSDIANVGRLPRRRGLRR